MVNECKITVDDNFDDNDNYFLSLDIHLMTMIDNNITKFMVTMMVMILFPAFSSSLNR